MVSSLSYHIHVGRHPIPHESPNRDLQSSRPTIRPSGLSLAHRQRLNKLGKYKRVQRSRKKNQNTERNMEAEMWALLTQLQGNNEIQETYPGQIHDEGLNKETIRGKDGIAGIVKDGGQSKGSWVRMRVPLYKCEALMEWMTTLTVFDSS